MKKIKTEDELVSEVISFKVTKQQKQLLEEQAANDKRTLSNYIKLLLNLL